MQHTSEAVGPAVLAGHEISLFGSDDEALGFDDVMFRCSCGEDGDGYTVTEAIWNAAGHLLGDQDGRYDGLSVEQWRDHVTDDMREAGIDPATWRWLLMKPGEPASRSTDLSAWHEVDPELPAEFT